MTIISILSFSVFNQSAVTQDIFFAFFREELLTVYRIEVLRMFGMNGYHGSGIDDPNQLRQMVGIGVGEGIEVDE